MAFISGFKYDIFISYAHVDNIAFSEKKEGWIEQFYKILDLMLAQRFGRTDVVKIWWDSRNLDGSVIFDDSIKNGINDSAIMICLNSPGYMASPYCKKELDCFYTRVQKEKPGLKVGDRSRIFNVLLNNIPFGEWPKELSGTSGFPFHDSKEMSDFGDKFDPSSTEFRTQMQNIRDAVWNLLKDFAATINTPVPPSPGSQLETKGNDAFTIYLGEVADTLRTPRKRMITELEKKGYNLISGVPPPDEAEAHEKATRNALQKADLSIHLLDEFAGREITGTPDICYPQKQTELALDSEVSQMIWMPAETDFSVIDDEKYKLFLQSLEKGGPTKKEFEFIRGAKSTLTQEIIACAEQVKARQLQIKPVTDKVSVLLDTHFNDQIYALDLSKIFLENQIQPFINPQEGDPGKNLNLLGDRLSQVKKLIFLYGNTSKEWVMERVSAALRLIINNRYPVEDFYIYLAPPHKEDDNLSINQRFLKVNVVNYSETPNINNAVLQQFLNTLKTSST
jgi:hypothetical protein